MWISLYIGLISCISQWTYSMALLKSPMQNPHLLEGDIIPRDRTRTAISDENKKWPNATVPYEIRLTTPRVRRLLQEGIEQFHKATCVRFVARQKEKDYLEVVRGEGCASYVGRIGGKQEVSLGKGCGYLGTVVHELGHAIGLYHEHKRSDRDNFLTIHFQNIPKEFHHAFEKLQPEQNKLYTNFDTESVMLYGSRAFTTNPNNYAIIKKDGTLLTEVHEKTGLSMDDAKRINLLYNCTGLA